MPHRARNGLGIGAPDPMERGSFVPKLARKRRSIAVYVSSSTPVPNPMLESTLPSTLDQTQYVLRAEIRVVVVRRREIHVNPADLLASHESNERRRSSPRRAANSSSSPKNIGKVLPRPARGYDGWQYRPYVGRAPHYIPVCQPKMAAALPYLARSFGEKLRYPVFRRIGNFGSSFSLVIDRSNLTVAASYVAVR